jgi:hypothetical protein
MASGGDLVPSASRGRERRGRISLGEQSARSLAGPGGRFSQPTSSCNRHNGRNSHDPRGKGGDLDIPIVFVIGATPLHAKGAETALTSEVIPRSPRSQTMRPAARVVWAPVRLTARRQEMSHPQRGLVELSFGAAAPPSRVMNSRRFTISNPSSQGRIAGYRIGEDQSAVSERPCALFSRRYDTPRSGVGPKCE